LIFGASRGANFADLGIWLVRPAALTGYFEEFSRQTPVRQNIATADTGSIRLANPTPEPTDRSSNTNSGSNSMWR